MDKKLKLCIAIQALQQPEVLFVDAFDDVEDVAARHDIMDFLHNYVNEKDSTNRNRTYSRRVILTLGHHHISSRIWNSNNMIDHVILLSNDGQLIYNGHKNGVERFFQLHGHGTPTLWNPIEHYYQTISNSGGRGGGNRHYSDSATNCSMTTNEWAQYFFQYWKSNLVKGSSALQSRTRRKLFHDTCSRSNNDVNVEDIEGEDSCSISMSRFFYKNVLKTNTATGTTQREEDQNR